MIEKLLYKGVCNKSNNIRLKGEEIIGFLFYENPPLNIFKKEKGKWFIIISGYGDFGLPGPTVFTEIDSNNIYAFSGYDDNNKPIYSRKIDVSNVYEYF